MAELLGERQIVATNFGFTARRDERPIRLLHARNRFERLAGKGGARPIVVKRRHAEGGSGGVSGAVSQQGLLQIDAQGGGVGGRERRKDSIGPFARDRSRGRRDSTGFEQLRKGHARSPAALR